LLEDLFGGYRQALRGQKIALPAKTSPYRDWAAALGRYALSEELSREAAHWAKTAIDSGGADMYRNDGAASGINETRTAVIDPETTAGLLQGAGKRYGTQTDELLLASLAVAACRWKGRKYITALIEGHGREPIDAGLSVDRTVGWFTSLYPAVLESAATVGETIIAAKETLRRIPGRGIGYGVWKYLCGREDLNVKAEVMFNYLGVLDGELDGYEGISISGMPMGLSVSERNSAGAGLCLNASVLGGRLGLSLSYDTGLYGGGDAGAFLSAYAGAVRDVVGACLSEGGVVMTPSDYGIDISLEAFRDIEKILETV
jgi:non-ribosomal peptide synthase protein (TIGR01720 family)